MIQNDCDFLRHCRSKFELRAVATLEIVDIAEKFHFFLSLDVMRGKFLCVLF